MGAGGVKVEVALDDPALEPSPDWTDITDLRRNLIAGYDLQRGRQFELDYTDTGSYTITVNDPDGILDPTNSGGPLTGLIEPDLQLRVSLWNPVADEWQVRSRLWIEDFDYDLDPSQRIHFLKISCYDIFALLTSIEMQPGQFGDPPPGNAKARAATIFFDNADFDVRINQVLENALGTTAAAYWGVVFSGNVSLLESVHSPGENPMEPIQRALDGEFPGVSNAYPDRFGRLAAHGRLARFDPAGVSAGAGPDAWDWCGGNGVPWKLGDGAAISGAPGQYVQIRPPYSWNRGRSRIINSALAYPKNILDTATRSDIPGQYVQDLTSIGLRGYQSWSKENLLTERGILTGNDGNAECKAFAQYYVNNYAEPRNRITALTVKAIQPTDARASKVWEFLCKHDIADEVEVTVTHPGGGGFNLEPFFIEGTHEIAQPLTAEYAFVTASLDVSPAAYFTGDLAGLDGG